LKIILFAVLAYSLSNFKNLGLCCWENSFFC